MCGCHLWNFPLSFVCAFMLTLSHLCGGAEPGFGTQGQPTEPGPLGWREHYSSSFTLSGTRPEVVHPEAECAEDVAVLFSFAWPPNRRETPTGHQLRVWDLYQEVLGHSMRMERRDPEKPRTRMSTSSFLMLQEKIFSTAYWPIQIRSTQARGSRKVHLHRP